MNKSLLVLNIILLVAVSVLFYLFFENKKRQNSSSRAMKLNDSTSSNQLFRVGYFDMDSIEANFSLFKEMQQDVSKKEDSINMVLNSARMNLQNKYRDYQERRATMTPADLEKAGNELTGLDNEIKNKEMALNQSFQSFYMNKQQEVIAQIKKYCIEFNKDKKFSFIIANEPGLVYYKDTAYNITFELLRGLNQIYNKQKKK
jgi:outer membrane protein